MLFKHVKPVNMSQLYNFPLDVIHLHLMDGESLRLFSTYNINSLMYGLYRTL